ncbi:MAG: CAP domain-containing protein [Acidimicrobiia bacterium]
MRRFKRIVTLAVTATIFVAAFATPALAGAEGEFVSKINASRAAAGKAPLEVYWDLVDDARAQSAAMAAKGSIFHNPNLAGVTSGWESLAENVGVGLDVDSLHQGFMNSAGHRANILGDFNYVGVGVTVDDAGLMWVTVVFMKAEPGLNGGGTTTTTTTPATTTTTTTPPAPPTTAPPSTSPAKKTVSPSAPSPSSGKFQSVVAASRITRGYIVAYGHPRGPYAF